jgi:hypothetical protein
MECSSSLIPQRSENIPKRLLDITSTNGSSEVRLRLIEVSELKENYITLSHIWGSCQLLSSTTENYRSHLDQIKVEDLPKTFKDAIMASQHLGVKFVWIDSLCIIQDSIEDWEPRKWLRYTRMLSYYLCQRFGKLIYWISQKVQYRNAMASLEWCRNSLHTSLRTVTSIRGRAVIIVKERLDLPREALFTSKSSIQGWTNWMGMQSLSEVWWSSGSTFLAGERPLCSSGSPKASDFISANRFRKPKEWVWQRLRSNKRVSQNYRRFSKNL